MLLNSTLIPLVSMALSRAEKSAVLVEARAQKIQATDSSVCLIHQTL